MSLLQHLGLPKPKNFMAAHGASAPPGAHAAPRGPAPVPQVQSSSSASRHEAEEGDEAKLRAESKKMQAAIEVQRKQASDALVQMRKLAPLLEAKVAAAKGDEKKTLATKQADLAKRTAQAEKAMVQADADLKALDSPGTGREELLAIMARHHSNAKVGEEIEVSSPGLDPYKKSVNKDHTTTTSSYEDGKATVDKVHDKQHVGLDGYTKEHSHETEVTTSGSTARNAEEKKTNVSLGGKVSVEEKKKAEIELADGRKSSHEHSTEKEISAKGASHSVTDKTTNLDGSSRSTTKKHEIERGEGKITATTGTSVTKTDASGTAHTTDKHASGGVIAGKDGYGAQGGVDGGKTVTSKGGMQAGFTAGAHGNIVCSIGKPSGDPPLYPVTVTVSFGVSVGVAGGAGKKEGSKASASVEVQASVDKTMIKRHMLTEAELGNYTKALKAASTGSTVAATEAEFAIITVGASQGWEQARQMWESGEKIDKNTVANLKRGGDSVEVGETKTGAVSISGDVGPVGGGVGVKVTDENSKKVTRTDQGALDAEGKSAHMKETSVSGNVNVGAAKVSVGTKQVHKTSFGFSIEIDPKNDPDGEILKAFGKCKNEMDYNIFIVTYTNKITVLGRTKGKADAESTETSVSVGGAKASIFTQQGVAKDEEFDGKGNLVHSKTVGTAGAGGEIAFIGDSKIDEATAEHDGDHNATLRLEQTENDKDYGKMLSNQVRKVPGGSHIVGKDKKKKEEEGAQGALSKAAGGGEEEDDTATKKVKGIKLTVKDLKRIGQIARTDPGRWTRAHHRTQERDDWEAARRAIVKANGDPAVVADELANFIGGDRVYRLDMVTMFVRGGNATNIGTAYEFPDSLKGVRADYERYIEAPFEPDLEKLAAINPANAEGLALSLAVAVDSLYARFYQAKDFDKPALKAEMLGAITRRRDAIADAVRKYAGKTSNEDERKATEAKVKRMLEHCFDFSASEKKLFADLDDDLGGYEKFRSADGKEVKDWLHQLKDLRTRWRENYDEAVRLAKSINMKQSAWDQDILRPNDAEYQKFYKAAERVGMV